MPIICNLFISPCSLNQQFARLQVVDTELESGRVYVGARDYLFQLDPDLNSISRYKTGPREELGSRTGQVEEVHVYNKGLAIVARESRLIACGTFEVGFFACGMMGGGGGGYEGAVGLPVGFLEGKEGLTLVVTSFLENLALFFCS